MLILILFVWNRTVCKYKDGFSFNKLQWLMSHQTKLNQTHIQTNIDKYTCAHACSFYIITKNLELIDFWSESIFVDIVKWWKTNSHVNFDS